MKKIVFLLSILIFFFAFFLMMQLKLSDFKLQNNKKKIVEFKKKDVYVIGWLRVEGTNIDMPVLLPTYEEDKLTKEDQYAWTNAPIEQNSNNNHLSILSHNIRNVSSNPIVGDKSMRQFEQLMAFIYPNFIEKNQFIEYTDMNYKSDLYRIYAVLLDKTDQYNLTKKSIYTKKEQEKYIKYVKNKSIFDMNVDVNANDTLISLITCTRFYKNTSYSFQVEARKLRKQELPYYKKVEKTKKYKKVEQQLKEGKKDEKKV